MCFSADQKEKVGLPYNRTQIFFFLSLRILVTEKEKMKKKNEAGKHKYRIVP